MEEIYTLYERELAAGRLLRTKDNEKVIRAWAEADVSDGDLEITIRAILGESFWAKQITPALVEKQRLARVRDARYSRPSQQRKVQEQASDDPYSIASIYADHGVPIPSL